MRLYSVRVTRRASARWYVGVTSTDRDFREALGDATNTGVGATTAVVQSAQMTTRFSRTQFGIRVYKSF